MHLPPPSPQWNNFGTPSTEVQNTLQKIKTESGDKKKLIMVSRTLTRAVGLLFQIRICTNVQFSNSFGL